jgi:peptidyl-prolyl cis-trans isomerase C
LHFVILGALAFYLHHLLVGAPLSDYVIAEDAPVARIRQDWLAAKGSLPSPEQEAALVDEWIEEEVLYRRAIELGIDANDTVVRRRLVQRMRFLLQDTQRIDPPDDAQLQAWLEAHPERFTPPAKTSFEHVFFSRGKRGANLGAAARAALKTLEKDPEARVVSDPFFRGASFEEATATEVKRAFGGDLAEAIEELPVNRWSGPLRSAYGLHLVRAHEHIVPPTPELDAIRDEVERDWLQAEQARLNQEALLKLRARYSPTEAQ